MSIFLKTNEASFKEVANLLKFLLTKSRDVSPEFFDILLSFTEANYILKTNEYFTELLDTLNKSRKLEADFAVITEIEKTRREIKRIHDIVSRSSLR